MPKFTLSVSLVLSALLASTLAGAAELDVVRLDLQSGTIPGVLPFDVPFMMVGQAPPGSVVVEGQLDEKSSLDGTFPDHWLPEEPLVSTVGKDGRFRMRFPALEPNHYFRFRFTLERRLTSTQSLELRRQLP